MLQGFSKNYIIFGMRGVGKTTIGKLVADKMGLDFIDLDKEIVEEIGQSIGDFVKKFGWEKFRDVEHKVLKKVLYLPGKKIISLGGGTIIFPRNQKLIMRKNYSLVYLKADTDTIVSRILLDKDNPNRPQLTKQDLKKEIELVFNERKSIYEKFAQYTVDANQDISSVVNDVLKIFGLGAIAVVLTDFEKFDLFMEKIENDLFVKFIEFRIDFLKDLNINKIKNFVEKSPRQVILTLRNQREGGFFNGSWKEEISILEKFIDVYSVDLLDFELDMIKNLNLNLTTFPQKIIVSKHFFEHTPSLDSLKTIATEIVGKGAYITKIASMIKNEKEKDVIFNLIKWFKDSYTSKEFVFIGMGEKGKDTRIELLKKGGFVSFASLIGSSAPGQLTLEEMKKFLKS